MAAVRYFWISLGLIWTTHEEYLVVSISVQNLVTIDESASFEQLNVKIHRVSFQNGV